MTSFLDDHVLKAIARANTRPLFFHEEAALEAAEKAGKKWDASRHPRDHQGRFIEIGGVVDMPDGGEARVLGLGNDNKIQVEDAKGKKRSIDADTVTQVEGANEGAPDRELREAPDPREEKKRIKESRDQIKARQKEIKDSRKDDREPNPFTQAEEWDAWEQRESERNAALRDTTQQLRQLTADEKALSGKKDDSDHPPEMDAAANPADTAPPADLGPQDLSETESPAGGGAGLGTDLSELEADVPKRVPGGMSPEQINSAAVGMDLGQGETSAVHSLAPERVSWTDGLDGELDVAAEKDGRFYRLKEDGSVTEDPSLANTFYDVSGSAAVSQPPAPPRRELMEDLGPGGAGVQSSDPTSGPDVPAEVAADLDADQLSIAQEMRDAAAQGLMDTPDAPTDAELMADLQAEWNLTPAQAEALVAWIRAGAAAKSADDPVLAAADFLRSL